MKFYKTHLSSLLIYLFLFFTSSVNAASSVSFQKIKSAEPSFKDIMSAHLRHEHLSDDEFNGWQKRIRQAPYLPKLYLGFDQQLKRSDSLSVNDNISITSGLVTEGPEDNNYDVNSDVGQVFRVRAVWDLDQLIFQHEQFSLASTRRQFAVERSREADAIYKIYEARYLCLAQYFTTRTAAFYTKYLLLTDRLDEITNGVFTNRFWRKQ